MIATLAAWSGSISFVRSPSFHFLMGQPSSRRIAESTSMPMTANHGRPGSENPWLSSTTSATIARTVPMTAQTARVDEEVLCMVPSLSDRGRLSRGDSVDVLVVEFGQNRADGAAPLWGVDECVSDELGPRSEDEGAFVGAWVRQRQSRGLAAQLLVLGSEADEVDVEGARSPP